MKVKISLVVLLIYGFSISCSQKEQFQITDLHIHLKGNFGIEDAVKKSEAENLHYGIAFNCGLNFPIRQDSQIDSVLMTMKDYPQFLVGMQAEGREWVNIFSEESIQKFDYVFTDAMTFTDEQGRRNRIWINSETWIDDEDKFMDYLVKTIVKIMNEEPIDIYVNPTYLPEQMAGRYDTFWTEERMDRVIEAANNNNIAIEINNRFMIPSEAFIKRAKKAGAKFTVGTNNADENFSGVGYALKMIEKCNLTEEDFFLPVK